MVKRYINIFKIKPLVTAFSSSLVIGYGICLLYIILIGNNMRLYEIPQTIIYLLIFGILIGGFSVFPVLLSILNLIYLISLKKDEEVKREEIKVIKDIVIKWNSEYKDKERVLKNNKLINLCNKILNNALNWPWLALIFMVPLLGILIGILALFGQAPDSVIKAFTETAEWNLSTKIPAQSLEYDGHYLCTVAAGGHKEIVKPIRLGRRGGKYIVVNRQLCIANAFEQIIEEKTPKFHYVVRSFYDKYGYPVAKHINSKYTADFIYFLMKPLEWIFLIVIYLFDNKPENRIAMQYLPKKKL